jgi:hypothetical protein
LFNQVLVRLVYVERQVRIEQGTSKSYYRLPMTRLEYGDIAKIPSNIFIAKRVRPDVEQLPFGHGGIHFQNFRHSANSLFGPSCSRRLSKGSVNDYMASEFRFCGPPRDLSSMPASKIKVLKPYACCLFVQPDLGSYNPPIKIQFQPIQYHAGVPKSQPFHIVIGYARKYLSLAIETGTMPAIDDHDEDRRKFYASRAIYLTKYGMIAEARTQVSPKLEVVASILREDPNTAEGATAGGRPHLILCLSMSTIKGKSQLPAVRSVPGAMEKASIHSSSSSGTKSANKSSLFGLKKSLLTGGS